MREVERGRYLIYRGHYAHALQLLAAMRRRLSDGARPGVRKGAPIDAYRYAREAKRREHDLLCRLVVLLNGTTYCPMLDGTPALGDFGVQVWGPIDDRPLVVPLREWMGARGAREWYRTGVEVPALRARGHPHYGVFAPTRGEYVELVAEQADAVGMAGRTAFDIGTGTGVLAFVLARRGTSRVVATDADPHAVACAQDNAVRLALGAIVGVCQVPPDNPFTSGSADILVCNPSWVPAEARRTSTGRCSTRPAASCSDSSMASPPISGRADRLGSSSPISRNGSDCDRQISSRAPPSERASCCWDDGTRMLATPGH